MPATYTPVRYPGGKTKIYPLVKSLIEINGLNNTVYCEAFAGGAGLACKLLLQNDISNIVINDFDRAVFCMWDAIVNHSDDLCAYIDDVDLSITTWLKCREVYQNQSEYDDFDLGKAAFFLNRTNVSGILSGGVIGGIEQKGRYLIDARFNREGLKNKIRALGRRRDDIDIHMEDAEDFIHTISEDVENPFAYFDPPYVQKGPGLYRSSFDEKKHRSLAAAIKSCEFSWFATYDADDLVDELYNGFVRDTIVLGYSAHSAGQGEERLIMSRDMEYEGAEDS